MDNRGGQLHADSISPKFLPFDLLHDSVMISRRHLMKAIPARTMLACLLFAGCSTKVSPELEQAKNVLARFLAPMYLQNSMFAVAYPECKPSQFIRFILSDGGAAELPTNDSMARDQDKEEAAAIGMPLWPNGVALVAGHPDPKHMKQIVLKHDDEHHVIILEAYDDSALEPSAKYEWVIEKVRPSEMAKMVFQSNAEMGMHFGQR
jgi:hypothetical protein